MQRVLAGIGLALVLAGCGLFETNDLPTQEVVVSRGADPRGANKVYQINLGGETLELRAEQTLRREVPIGRYTLVATTDPARFDLRPVLENVPLDRASLGFAVYADRPTVIQIETGPFGGPRLSLQPTAPVTR